MDRTRAARNGTAAARAGRSVVINDGRRHRNVRVTIEGPGNETETGTGAAAAAATTTSGAPTATAASHLLHVGHDGRWSRRCGRRNEYVVVEGAALRDDVGRERAHDTRGCRNGRRTDLVDGGRRRGRKRCSHDDRVRPGGVKGLESSAGVNYVLDPGV